MPAISLEGVSKLYRTYPRQRDRVKEFFSFGKVKRSHEYWALKDVDLDVEPGVALGILGRNGAGKSTLLKIISGVLEPTSGKVQSEGRLAALLQLGAGFNAEFTGRENVMLNGLILGISRREMLERFEEIEEFADLGEFMEQPVKTYSSGMRARLGFAVAVNVEPDILVVDETLSVGDAIFKQMGIQKMQELRDSGTTILFVSHSVGMVKNFCTEAILLHEGEMVASGLSGEVVDRYNALLSEEQTRRSGRLLPEHSGEYDIEEEDPEEPSFKKNPELERRSSRLRHGTGEARIAEVELLDEDGKPAEAIDSEEEITLRVHLRYEEAVEKSRAGIALRNKAGLDVFSTDTALERASLGRRDEGERVLVDFTFRAALQPGDYSVAAFISHGQNNNIYLDWVNVATAFKVARPRSRGAVRGLVHLPTEVEIHTPDREEQK